MRSNGLHPAGFDPAVPPEERYHILGRIAQGGMAEIYLARLLLANGQEKEVVLKRLMPELQNDHEFVAMFHDEANIASQLSHPNIVQILELGEIDNSLFISMELLKGANLRDLLARLSTMGRTLPLGLGMYIASEALAALSYAHDFCDEDGVSLNVVHRDVSPQNIIVTYDGEVKLVDFGVAKAEGRLHKTRAGLIKGKFAYMSPEQVNDTNLDGRSDLFALGEVIYELLLRRHPFYAESDMEVLRAILQDEPMHPRQMEPDFPVPLAQILLKSLSKDRESRFDTAAQMRADLESLIRQERKPPNQDQMGRFIRELFEDRLRMEQRSREAQDEKGLVDALIVGRANHVGMLSGTHNKPRAISATAPELMPSALENESSVVTDPGEQKKDWLQDPAEHGAHSDPVMPQDVEDDGEMPTMLLSDLNPDDLADIRKSPQPPQAQLQPQSLVPKPGPGAIGGSRPDSVLVVPADPSAQGPRIIPSAHQPRSIVPGGSAVPQDPALQGAPRKVVTTRSQTVVAQEAELSLQSSPRPTDRLGLIFFICGLGALLGAIFYAAYMYSRTQS